MPTLRLRPNSETLSNHRIDLRTRHAAIWRRPSGWPDPARIQIRSLPAYLAVFSRRFFEAGRAVNVLARVHPREPHWYLPFVGVLPDALGSGRGTSLLAPVLKRCDEEQTGSYLEATSVDSARFFARLGFVPRDEVVVNGVTVRPMWRDPDAAPTIRGEADA